MKNFIQSMLFTGIALLMVSAVNGQSRYFDERYIFTQHNIYPTLLNPGAIGVNDYQELFVNYRSTWSGFEEAPKTFAIGYNGPVGNRLGFGAQILSDRFGALNTTKGQVGLSYTIDSPTNKVGFGITTEYIQHALSGSGLNSTQVDKSDPLILERLDGVQYFDASFGIYGLYNNRLRYGIAFPSVISSRISDTGNDDDRSLGYILQVGYRLESETTGISLEPALAVKSLMNVPTHIDVLAKFGFLEDKLIGGFNYTVGGDERYGFLIGTVVESLSINYVYNVSSADFQPYNNGAHELSLALRFGENKKGPKDMMEVMEEN